MPISPAPASSDFELLHVAAQARDLFAHVAAFGGNRRFLRQARRIELRFAEQFLQARFEPLGKGRPCARSAMRFGLRRKLGDRAQPLRHFDAQRVRLIRAHAIEFVERFHQAFRHRRFELRKFVFERSRRRANHAGQAQNRSQIRLRLDFKIASQLIHGLQIRRGNFAIHSHRRRPRQFVMQRNIQMAAPHSFAHDLPNARLDRLEALRHAQMQIEKTMIHAAHGNAQAPAVFDDARLRVTCHRLESARAR